MKRQSYSTELESHFHNPSTLLGVLAEDSQQKYIYLFLN